MAYSQGVMFNFGGVQILSKKPKVSLFSVYICPTPPFNSPKRRAKETNNWLIEKIQSNLLLNFKPPKHPKIQFFFQLDLEKKRRHLHLWFVCNIRGLGLRVSSSCFLVSFQSPSSPDVDIQYTWMSGWKLVYINGVFFGIGITKTHKTHPFSWEPGPPPILGVTSKTPKKEASRGRHRIVSVWGETSRKTHDYINWRFGK